MAFVVTEPCVGCRDTSCVVICPMECFYGDERQLFIDPQDCIDCEACVNECPVSAIYHENEVPAPWRQYVELNATRSAQLKREGKKVTEKQCP